LQVILLFVGADDSVKDESDEEGDETGED